MRKANYLIQSMVLASALVLLGSRSALADITMTFNWNESFWQAGYTANYINSSDAIGIYGFDVDPKSSPNPGTPFYSVCVSPNGLLNGGTYTYNVLSFSSASPGIYPNNWAGGNVSGSPQYWGINNAAWLWNTYGMNIVNNTGNIGYQSQRAAALELAVWTVLYDSAGYGTLGSPAQVVANGGVYWNAPTITDATTASFYTTYMNAFSSSAPNHASFTGNILGLFSQPSG